MLTAVALTFAPSAASADPIRTAPTLASTPIPVSPGSGEQTGRCPTFSWGEVPGAWAYDLVVVALSTAGEPLRTVLEHSIPGGALLWTPALDHCLPGQARYAWLIRARTEDEVGPWSRASLFEVPAPAPAGREAGPGGLAPVPRLRARVRAEPVTRAKAGKEAASTRPDPVDRPGAADGGPVSRSNEGTASSVFVEDAAVETVADPPCFPEATADNRNHRFIDCGNGTVHDTATGLLWLADASCGRSNLWQWANRWAASLGAPACGLTDHSQPGDWRLPTTEEWESIGRPGICGFGGQELAIVGRDGSCWGPGNEWASGAEGSFFWTMQMKADDDGVAWFFRPQSGQLDEMPIDENLVDTWPVRSQQ